MVIKNKTKYNISTALKEAVADYQVDGLTVELKYCPEGSRRFISGTYYRRTYRYEDGKLIRLRINRYNKYPIEVRFRTSEYSEGRDSNGGVVTYQKLIPVKFQRAEDLILAIFLHEFSHYLDHVDGLNGRYKQTKADKFAVNLLEKLGIIDR